MKRNYFRSISIIMAVIFICQNAAWASPYTSPQSIVHSPQIYIPEQYGKLEKSAQDLSPSARGHLSIRQVVLIKDAHCHYEARKNIAKILDILIMENKDKNLLPANEVSEYLRLPLSTLYRLSKNGILEAIKVGRQWRYSSEDIEKYISSLKNGRNSSNKNDFNNEERRDYPRLNCYINCNLTVNLLPIKNLFSSGLIRNISGNGAFVYPEEDIMEKIDIGDPIKLEFNLDQGNGTIIETKCRVVRKSSNGYGIRFRYIEKEYQGSIIQYVG